MYLSLQQSIFISLIPAPHHYPLVLGSSKLVLCSSYFIRNIVNQGLQAPKSYRDDKTAWEMTDILAAHFRHQLKDRIQKSSFFGIMADETTDNSVTQQLIIYIKFLDIIDDQFIATIEYLDLIKIG